MPDGNRYSSPQAFLSRMDLGLLDGNLSEEIKKLSRDQLEDVARVLLERLSRPENSK